MDSREITSIEKPEGFTENLQVVEKTDRKIKKKNTEISHYVYIKDFNSLMFSLVKRNMKEGNISVDIVYNILKNKTKLENHTSICLK